MTVSSSPASALFSSPASHSSPPTGRGVRGGGLPLERKLPLLIFGVLATALAISLALSYYEVRRSAQQSAADRLSGLSRVFATLVEQQMNTRLTLMRRIARDTAVVAALREPSRGPSAAARKALATLILTPADTATPAQLWTPDDRLVDARSTPRQRGKPSPIRLETPEARLDNAHMRDEFSGLANSTDSQHVGRIYTSNGHAVFWVAVPVRPSAAGGVAGFVAQQRRISTNPRSLQPLRDLIGPNIEFYLRNGGDDTWVQLTGTAQKPPTQIEPLHDSLAILTYGSRGPLLASTATIAGTPFLITVEEPMQSILAGPQRTTRALAVIAMILIVAGAAIAWIISRRMARPLVELTAAVEAMAQGKYSQRVPETAAHNGSAPGRDEIGRLATAFNRMATQVQESSDASTRAVDRLTHSVATQEFLAEASRIVAGSLSDESLLAELARFCVPAIADSCSIHIADDDGEIRRVVTARFDQAAERVVEEVSTHSPIWPDGPGEVEAVVRSRRPRLVPSLDLASINSSAPDAAVRPLEQTHPRSFMAVPLVARGRAFGAMAFAMAASGRAFGSDDLDLAVELGRRTAAAIDNAIIYRQSIALRMEAEAASNAKSDFLAKMSHEIRTPINAMMGYAELLQMGISGPVTEMQTKQLARIRASGDHLTSLIDEILDLAKIEAGRMAVHAAIGRAADPVDAALALIRPLASAKGVEIEATVESDSRASYVGDPQRVQQILANLLSNAVKFTESGGRVSVSCGSGMRPGSPSSDPARWTWIEVADTGVGIAEDDLDRIFQPFIQVDGGYTRSHGGTGLGLTISRTLAQMMGGDITVTSAPGRGSRFTLWLSAPNS